MGSRGPRLTIPTQLVLRALLEDPTRELYGVEVGAAAGLASGSVHPILEFIAEMHGMPRLQQRRHAAQVLSRAWALRAALAEAAPGTTGERTMTRTRTRPLLCRLNILHRYRIGHTEDGGRYRHCTRCGKDRTPRDYGYTIGA